MNKKILSIGIIALILLFTVVTIVYTLRKKQVAIPSSGQVNQEVKQTEGQNSQEDQELVAQAQTQEVQKSLIAGTMISINEKQLYLKLDDGKGVAINIKAQTPVKVSGKTDIGNLSNLKSGDKLAVIYDQDMNAIEINIEK